jgi:hypothetical protein
MTTEVTRWLKPNRWEHAAMWLYGDEYAKFGLSAVDFYKRLPDDKKNLVITMVNSILDASDKPRR